MSYPPSGSPPPSGDPNFENAGWGPATPGPGYQGYGAPPGGYPGTGPQGQPGQPQWGQQAQWGQWPQQQPSAPKPGVIPLRPLNVGEVLDGAFTYIRKYPAATLGLAAIVAVVIALVQTVPIALSLHALHNAFTFTPDTTQQVNPGPLIGADVLSLVADIAITIVRLIATGMFVHIMGKAVLGEGLGIGGAWQLVKPQFLRLLGLAGLYVAVLVAWIAVVGGIGLLLIVGNAAAVGVIWLVVVGSGSLIAAIYLGILVVLAAPALVLEDIGIITSLRRSVLLVRGSWWRIFGISLLANVLVSVVGGILIAPFEIGAIVLSTGSGPGAIAVILLALGSMFSTILTVPFTAGVVSLLYVDQRMRREGLDLTLTSATSSSF